MSSSDFDQCLFTEVPASEEVQVSGGFGYGGFRMHTSRMQNVPVASMALPPTGGGGNGSGGGRGGGRGNGFYFDLQFYLFGMGAAYMFGNPGVTPAEVQYVWQMALRLR